MSENISFQVLCISKIDIEIPQYHICLSDKIDKTHKYSLNKYHRLCR